MTTSDRRWPLWPWLVLTVAGVVVTVVAAIVGAAASTNESADSSSTRVTVTATQVQTSTVRVTVTVAPPPEIPATALLDGIHVVGIEVQPGIYQTTGPSGTNAGGCYWTRTDGAGGLIENGVITGPGTLTVSIDELVETAGCQPWQKVG
ncbi:hypothetical protein [Actinophytocola algeriensis]|uniref:Uncharacterized protein n=1 Tax=Actinophytocola algeriensis TaxID=1768010 RepID=A0A7W7QAH6_9PSEU|nr:hypothetical protein [Actinophytocola algeriensis]MBB4910071.1 hypothetical protein [Actinophytocola algeriensis]MBE1476061.1 hypothetical protein [Actinophytocola algeriensis]